MIIIFYALIHIYNNRWRRYLILLCWYRCGCTYARLTQEIIFSIQMCFYKPLFLFFCYLFFKVFCPVWIHGFLKHFYLILLYCIYIKGTKFQCCTCFNFFSCGLNHHLSLHLIILDLLFPNFQFGFKVFCFTQKKKNLISLYFINLDIAGNGGNLLSKNMSKQWKKLRWKKWKVYATLFFFF